MMVHCPRPANGYISRKKSSNFFNTTKYYLFDYLTNYNWSCFPIEFCKNFIIRDNLNYYIELATKNRFIFFNVNAAMQKIYWPKNRRTQVYFTASEISENANEIAIVIFSDESCVSVLQSSSSREPAWRARANAFPKFKATKSETDNARCVVVEKKDIFELSTQPTPRSMLRAIKTFDCILASI